MSTNNIALVSNLANDGYYINDGNIAQGTTLPTAVRVNGNCIRVVGGTGNSGLVLPSIVSGEAGWLTFVINDAVSAIKVYCAAGESHNGVANASLAIPAGQAAVFSPVLNSRGGTINWSSAVLA